MATCATIDSSDGEDEFCPSDDAVPITDASTNAASTSDTADKTRMLKVTERRDISKVLQSLNKESLATEVVATVSEGLHFTCYTERKAFWDCISSSIALKRLITEATAEYSRLYLAHGYGRNKYANFLKAWLQYMLTFTGDRPNSRSCDLWKQVTDCYPHSVSEDTHRVVVCDILHTLQSHLHTVVLQELSKKSTPSTTDEAVKGSDDTALLRIGGWAIHALVKRTREQIKKQSKDAAALAQQLQLLEAMKLAKDEKVSLPQALNFLDRGGLTFPKEEIVPYLRLVEERMLEILNRDNYRRYGQHLFEVTKRIITDDTTLLQTFTGIATKLVPVVTSSTVAQIHGHFLAKIYNCRCNEYLKSIQQEVLAKQKKSVDVHVGLRDELKTYASNKQINE